LFVCVWEGKNGQLFCFNNYSPIIQVEIRWLMRSISGAELRQWREAGKPFLLVDVREEHERATFHIGGLHLPMSEGGDEWKVLQQELPVVVYCAKGIRSAIFIQRLERVDGMPPMYNLQGGLTHWKTDFDERAD